MSGLAGIAWGAKLLGVRKVLAKVPTFVWVLIAASLVLVVAWRWHVGEVKGADRAGFNRGVDTTKTAYKKALAIARVIALQRRAKQEAAAAAITKELNGETARLRRERDAAARRLLDHGPGAAACRGPVDHPGVPAAAGGNRPAATGSAALAGLPSDQGQQLAGLPWAGTVALAANHDALRAYYLADRAWHERQAAEWEKLRR